MAEPGSNSDHLPSESHALNSALLRGELGVCQFENCLANDVGAEVLVGHKPWGLVTLPAAGAATAIPWHLTLFVGISSGHYQGLLFAYWWVTICQIHQSQMSQLTQRRPSDGSHKFHVPGLYPFIKQLPPFPKFKSWEKKNFKVGCVFLRLVAIDFQTSLPPYPWPGKCLILLILG